MDSATSTASATISTDSAAKPAPVPLLLITGFLGSGKTTLLEFLVARLAAQGRVTEVADVAELFKYLERGMVDAVVSQPIVFREYLGADAIQNELVQRDWAPAEQFSVGSLAFSRKSFTPEQAERWDALVAGILKDQTMLRILQDFMPPDQARGVVYRGPRMLD